MLRNRGLAGAASVFVACLSLAAETRRMGDPQAVQAATPPRQGILVAPGGREGRGVFEAPAADDPANRDADLSPKPPVLPLLPSEEAKQFWLPPGYRLEPVLSDPAIEEPAQIAFDGNGRMFVVELRGYVQTLDGVDFMPPLGRISVHEDRDNDGVFEDHRVFVDKLVFPRFVLPLGANSILTMETNADEVWKYTDTDNDGTADKKELFVGSFGRAGNLEHQQASLLWAMDNWLYSTVNTFRIRATSNGVVKEPTGPNGGQWGVTQDNSGKVWFQGGASGIPAYFQFPIHYGNFSIPDQLEPGLNVTWGAPILIGDMQAGLPGTRLPDGSLILATAGAGNDIYRGDRLPADLVGDYLYGEAVGRIVRRLKPVKTEGLTQLRNAYPRSEFIRSLDPLFRPVEMATAPDGTLYIVDMYRGVVEGAPWAKQGTYLRKKIEQYQLDKVLAHGRIWRLAYNGMERDRRQPRMLNETAAQLVGHLSHPNGWWRDTAQQLLVLKHDQSVVPALQQIVRTSQNLPARFHALWTLEGLGALDAALLRTQLEDPDPGMRIQAIRVSETLYKAGDSSFAKDYRALTKDADADVAIQAMLTLSLFKAGDLSAVVRAAQAANPARGVQEVARRILQPPASLTFGGRSGNLTLDQQATLRRGATIYNELCATCHGPDGRGMPIEGRPGAVMAPPLLTSSRVQGHRDYVIKTMLHGLSGQLDGRIYADAMVPMGTNTDEWIAAVASYVRSGFGSTWVVTPSDVAKVRTATPNRSAPWTLPELESSLPRPLIADPAWKVTASHNPADAVRGVNFAGWTSGAPQQAGMWFQIELPAPMTLVEMQFDSPVSGSPPAAGTSPRGYEVQVSMDGQSWSPPVAQDPGTGAAMVMTFAPTRARFVRLTQTAAVENAPAWSIQRLRLFQAPASVADSR
jgi:mono/diheme cytochrome c family protein/glucose/arabinose dehydrogenase